MWAPDDLTMEQYAEDLRARIGHRVRNEWSRHMFSDAMPGPYHAFNTAAHPDSIRKFVDGIGDLNPRYRDPAHPGGLLAPPTFLYSVAYGHYPDPGDYAPPRHIQGMYAGDEWEWFDEVRAGDEIDVVTTIPTEVVEKRTRSFGDVLFVYGVNEFSRRATGDPLARCTFWQVLRPGVFHGRPTPPEPVRHTPEAVAAVHAAQDAEVVRGAEPRYWEDVEVGEELPPIVRGPFTVMEAVAWIVGGMGERYFISDRLGRYIHDRTGWSEWDERLSMHKNFHDHSVSEGAMGAGAHRSSWLGIMLTNWAGDAGAVTRMRSEHRAQGQFGNIYTSWGRVTGKRLEGDHALVDIECGIDNHRGVRHLVGDATVRLPSRAGAAT